jgi:hypothetical protein
MANATVSRVGQANLAGDANALFLKVFSGEVLSSYNAKTVMKDKTRTRSISSGKSAQFAAVGRTTAEYHTPGTEITGMNIEHGEKVITIDDLLISHAFIANIDEAKNHYEVRSEYSSQIGAALAQTYDRNLLSMAVKACSDGDTGAVADQGNASRVALGASPTTADIIGGIYDAAASFDNLYIPSEDRYALVPPAVYYDLVQNDKLLDRDYSDPNGSYAMGRVVNVAGFRIVSTPNLAINHLNAGTPDYPDTAANKYGVNATTYKALCMHKSALGTVKLMDIASESEYDIRRQGTLMVSKMAVGHGVLRPEGLIALDGAA